MTQIDTLVAAKHWGPKKDGEIGFLKAIEFIAIDGNDCISLSTDEENNGEIRLTKKAALWLSKKLIEYARMIK